MIGQEDAEKNGTVPVAQKTLVKSELQLSQGSKKETLPQPDYKFESMAPGGDIEAQPAVNNGAEIEKAANALPALSHKSKAKSQKSKARTISKKSSVHQPPA